MAAVTTAYDIKIRYVVDRSAANSATSSVKNLGFASTAAAVAVGSLAAGVGGAFGGAILSSLSSAVNTGIEFNKQIEDATLNLAGLAQLNLGGSFKENLTEANKLVTLFQQAAIKSTATTQEFVNVASLIEAPILRAGGSMQDLFKITKSATVAAKAFNIAPELASRDIEQALAGTLTKRDRFARALIEPMGLTTEAWNKLIKDKPQQAVDQLLKAFSNPAIKELGEQQEKSWSGVLSTAVDLKNTFLGTFTGPIFASVKTFLSNINKELISGSSAIKTIANDLGTAFAAMFNFFTGMLPSIDTVIASIDLIRDSLLGVATFTKNLFSDLKFAVLDIAADIQDAFISPVSELIGFISNGTFSDLKVVRPAADKRAEFETMKYTKMLAKSRMGLDTVKESDLSSKRNELKRTPPSQTNVTISRIEIASDDPDRFAFNLVNAFQDITKNPVQAANALREG